MKHFINDSTKILKTIHNIKIDSINKKHKEN